MRSLTGLKVVISLKLNGHAQYPDFNQLQVIKQSGMDWSRYVDTHGLGWHYDKVSGHRHEDEEASSPFGQQHGMLLVPEVFALQAVVAFPDSCTRFSETQCQDFYDTRAHAHERENDEDLDVLEKIRVKDALGLKRSKEDDLALDPKQNSLGIRKNLTRRWADRKNRDNFTYKE